MNEIYDGPIQSGEIKTRKTKKKIIMIIIFIIIIFVVSIVNFVMNFFTDVGQMEYVELDGVKIPTLYKYTEYDDTFMSIHDIHLKDEDIEVNYSVIHLRNILPQEVKETYIAELNNLRYDYVKKDDVDFYVLNIDNNSKFIYIMISDTQIKYGVCLSGRYEDIVYENL